MNRPLTRREIGSEEEVRVRGGQKNIGVVEEIEIGLMWMGDSSVIAV